MLLQKLFSKSEFKIIALYTFTFLILLPSEVYSINTEPPSSDYYDLTIGTQRYFDICGSLVFICTGDAYYQAVEEIVDHTTIDDRVYAVVEWRYKAKREATSPDTDIVSDREVFYFTMIESELWQYDHDKDEKFLIYDFGFEPEEKLRDFIGSVKDWESPFNYEWDDERQFLPGIVSSDTTIIYFEQEYHTTWASDEFQPEDEPPVLTALLEEQESGFFAGTEYSDLYYFVKGLGIWHSVHNHWRIPMVGIHLADQRQFGNEIVITTTEFNEDDLLWCRQESGISEWLRAVSFIDNQHGWIVGNHGIVLRTINGGATWNQVDARWEGGETPWHEKVWNDQFLLDAKFFNEQDGWAVFGSEMIPEVQPIFTSDGGETWKNPSGYFHKLFFVDKQHGWAIKLEEEDGVLLSSIAFSDNSGESWEQISHIPEVHLAAIHFTDTNKGWVAGLQGTIMHTIDGGVNWHEQESGLSESLTAIYFVNDQYGWIVGENGVILHTANGGQDWEQQESDKDQNLWAVHFGDEKQGYVSGEGIVLWTDDSGQTWVQQDIDTETNLFFDVYRTTDYGFVLASNTIWKHTTETCSEPTSANTLIARHKSFKLDQNYPNPFNPTTAISYHLPVSSAVLLEVYDLLGRRVATLVNEQVNAGSHNVQFDASNLASGVYIYRMTTPHFSKTRQMMVIK